MLRITRRNTKNNHKYFCLNCKDENWLIECICGKCDEVIFLRDKNKKIRSYKNGHRPNADKHCRWKGKEIPNNGYIYIHIKNHYSGKTRIGKHRWVYEQHYNCYLLKWTEIDHINGQRDDNRIENLRPMFKSQHRKRHMKGNDYGKNTRIDMSDRRCSICGSDNLDYIRKDTNSPFWFGNEIDGWRCLKCNRKKYYEKNKYRFWLK